MKDVLMFVGASTLSLFPVVIFYLAVKQLNKVAASLRPIDLVVTRHDGLLEFLIDEGLATADTPTIQHITDASILEGKHVAGVLPVNLAAKADMFTEVQMSIPFDMRGKELSKEQTRQYAVAINTYESTLLSFRAVK